MNDEMNEINLQKIKPGDYFEQPVFLDENYILLNQDTPLSAPMQRRLQKWKFLKLYTEGSTFPQKAPGLELEEGVISPNGGGGLLDIDEKEKEGMRKCQVFFSYMLETIDDIYRIFRDENDLAKGLISELIKEAINITKDNKQYILRYSEFPEEKYPYDVTHSARTTILALVIGEKLKWPNHKLIELGMSAVLHEIGMLKIPESIHNKTGALDEKEKKVIATHPIFGFRMLKEFTLPRDVLLGVLEHHERINGTGYPQNIQGEKISMFGKIIAVACSYDAQVSNRPHREGKNAHVTMMQLLKEMQSLYDETVMRTLLMILSIYPIGSYVRLNNGQIGKVINSDDENPKFPHVKLLLRENGAPFKEAPMIKTQENEAFGISEVLTNKEYEEIATGSQ